MQLQAFKQQNRARATSINTVTTVVSGKHNESRDSNTDD